MLRENQTNGELKAIVEGEGGTRRVCDRDFRSDEGHGVKGGKKDIKKKTCVAHIYIFFLSLLELFKYVLLAVQCLIARLIHQTCHRASTSYAGGGGSWCIIDKASAVSPYMPNSGYTALDKYLYSGVSMHCTWRQVLLEECTACKNKWIHTWINGCALVKIVYFQC